MRSGGEAAETGFRLLGDAPGGLRGCQALEAAPLTGRTHQIRVHAAEKGFPILGDRLYGGSAARRVYLHSSELTIVHPVSSKEMSFRAEPDFEAEPGDGLRAALIEPELTNAYRLIHGASDGWPGWYVERAGDFLLSQAELPLGPEQAGELARLVKALSLRGAYHKILRRRLRQAALVSVGPRLVLGEAAPKQILIRENGVEFGLSFEEGYSAGLFLDQRDNRRRLLTGHIAADFPLLRPDANKQDWELLNAFAYTCGFSVCAARAGARTTNLDLSKKYLEWGRQNFALNTLDPDAHQFIYGDAFDWLRRLGRKKRVFDVVLLDPPTFSQSKESGVFQADKDYRRLVSVALPLLRSGGVLFASTNAADWKVEGFISAMDAAIRESGRKILQRHYGPQPPDFPVSRAEPAYLKTVWLRLQ